MLYFSCILFKIIDDEEYFNSKIRERKKENTFNAEIVEKEIGEIDRKISKVMDLMLDDSMQIEVVKNKIVELNKRKDQLSNLMSENKERKDKSGLIKETIITIRGSWDKLSIEEKNELLRRVIDVVWIDGNTYEIIWAV